MEDIREKVKELRIGLKVRRLRQDRRLTLQDMSEATGLSKPLLSQIENDQVIPPIATLLRISKALQVGIHTFFQEADEGEKCLLVRADQRRLLRRRLKEGDQPPYTYHCLAYGKRHKHLEPFLVEFDVSEWRDDLLVSHEGEEFLFLLEGELEFHYGGQVMTLGPGDSVYYDSSEPHGFLARGASVSRAVAVLYSKEL